MTIEAMVAKACPGSTVTDVKERTGGQLSSVFEVQRENDEPLIVKVYKPEWAWKQAKEVHVYGLLEGVFDGEVPRVIHAEPAGDQDAFTVLTKIEGVPLSEAEPPDWQPIYVQLGKILHRMHQIPQPAYGYLVDQILEPLPDNEQYVQRQFAKKLGEFEQLGGDPALHQQITEYVAKHTADLAIDHAVLCHNDFHEGNILVDPQTWQVTGFIDVENAIAADPLMDVAKTVAYSIRDNAEKFAGLEAGYGALDPEKLALYRVYHSLELWDWFKSIGETTYLDSIAGDIAGLVSGTV
ncbi:phosphotransferase family protein [Kribbella sp. NPDC058245]|uniref:phosphotransferase family protein n=1 Tax=Kribbella sp. NPDC058245 TaxID=3346399 RepID=UPI0036F175F3